jgi:anti-sigma-K factor RskA
VSHEPFESLAAVYAVGALDGDDLAQFEAHLPTCGACQATVRDAEETLARAMLASPAEAPPPEARAALVRRIAERRGARFGAWLRWTAATAVAAAAAAMFAGAWVAVRYEAELGRMARESAAVKERVARDEAALQAQLAFYRDAVDLLRDPATRVVELRGRGPGGGATGRMIWNDGAGGHLVVAGLAPAAAGKTYELWTIAGGTPHPAGVFGVDGSGRGAHRVPQGNARGGVDVFAVTLEPEGGVSEPTGPIVLASK